MKPTASLSLDLDNKWSYMKTHGDPNWVSYPSYLDIIVPRVLKLFKEENLTITFFVVGVDADRPENQAVIKSIAEAGHEIGNHSYNHEPWLQFYTEAQIEEEFKKTEETLERVTGRKPIGFRGPGFSMSDTVLEVLGRRGYVYDCTTFPTYLGPLARAYYFMTAKLDEKQKQERKQLFGTFKDGLRTNRAYRLNLKQRKDMVEIPVTTLPIFKAPFHVSYILYLAMFSKPLALFYFRMAIWMCRLFGIQPSILLHPLDFMGHDDNLPELAFFPAMRMTWAEKVDIARQTMRILSHYYNVVPMHKHAQEVGKEAELVGAYPVLGLR